MLSIGRARCQFDVVREYEETTIWSAEGDGDEGAMIAMTSHAGGV